MVEFAITYNSFFVLLLGGVLTFFAWNPDVPLNCDELSRAYWKTQDGLPSRYVFWIRAVHLFLVPFWIFAAFFFPDSSDLLIATLVVTLLRNLLILVVNRAVLGRWRG